MFRAVSDQFKPWLDPLRRHRTWILLGLTMLLVALVRIRLLSMPIERDEGEYAYAGQLMLQGVPPYKLAYNMKLPGTYAAYALIMSLFGQSPAGIHFGLMLVNLASIVLVFFLGRKLLDETAGLVAAATFALLSLGPSVLGLAAHATHFVLLPALGGILLLLRACKTLKPPTSSRGRPPVGPPTITFQPSTLLLSGLLFGLAFLMKQHGIFFGVFGLIYLMWTHLEYLLDQDKNKWRPPAPPPQRRSLLAQDSLLAQAAPAGSPKPPFPWVRRTTLLPSTQPASVKSDFAPSATLPAGVPARGSPDPVSASSPRDETQNSRPQKAPAPVPSVTPPASRPVAPPAVAPPIVSPWRALLKSIVVFTSGLALPYIATCLLLWVCGAFKEFTFWTIIYAREYVSQVSLVNGPDLLRNALHAAVGPNLLLWILPFSGLLLMWWDTRRTRNCRFLLTLLLLCSLLSVSIGLYFRGHYFILLLPVLGLLNGVAVSRSIHLFRRDSSIEVLIGVPIIFLFVVGVGAALIGNGSYWFEMSPVKFVRSVYQSSIFSEAANVAAYIKKDAAKGASVAVMGSEPEIYFLSRHRSATGFIYTYPLMEQHEYASKMQGQMIAEIERNRPEYVVYVGDPYSWLPAPGSDHKIFDWWERYWTANLNLETTLPIVNGAEQALDSNGAKLEQVSGGGLTTNLFYIFKRKVPSEK